MRAVEGRNDGGAVGWRRCNEQWFAKVSGYGLWFAKEMVVEAVMQSSEVEGG